MRLSEVERGDSVFRKLLIGFISTVSGMRLPDAARAVWYHKDFFGEPMAAWTQAAMRGESEWSVGERELMAAMVAKWNACPFCIGAHSAVASKAAPATSVESVLSDFARAPISDELKATLKFLHVLTTRPADVTAEDARAVLGAGVSREALTDAVAVASVFATVTRYANALGFAIPTDDQFTRAAGMLLKRGYAA
jgi:uncharacterized peroxidase-related enzyme